VWRLAAQVTVQLAGQPRAAMRWDMRRNCSATPAQLMAVYLSLCVVSLGIAAVFFTQGATLVAAFAALELMAVGVALLVYARHAGDRETITLVGRQVEVECIDGRQQERSNFRAEWLAVEPSAGQGSLIELSGQGQRVRIGRFLRPEMRAALAQELRRAMRRACLVIPPELPGNPTQHAR
jgi:uncharacterized membrane protein